jgi:hypothetical protein
MPGRVHTSFNAMFTTVQVRPSKQFLSTRTTVYGMLFMIMFAHNEHGYQTVHEKGLQMKRVTAGG